MKIIYKILIGIFILSIGLGIIANKMIEDKKNAEIEAEKRLQHDNEVRIQFNEKLKFLRDEEVRLQTERNKIFDTAEKLNDECNSAINERVAQAHILEKIESINNYEVFVTAVEKERTKCNRLLVHVKEYKTVLNSGKMPYWATDTILRIESILLNDDKLIDWAHLRINSKKKRV